MGTIYNLPIVTPGTLLNEGLVVGTRSRNGITENYYIGSAISGTRLAGFLHDDFLYLHYPQSIVSGENGYVAANASNWNVITYITNDNMSNIEITKNPHFYPGSVLIVGFMSGFDGHYFTLTIDYYETSSQVFNALGIAYRDALPITYRLVNCSAPTAPTEELVGNTVNVDLIFPEGYGIVNPSSDIYVANNGVVVPSSYSNGCLTFTMPDPS